MTTRVLFAIGALCSLTLAPSGMLAQDATGVHLSDLRVTAVPPIGDAPTRGAANPKVTIVEFVDYTCPYTTKMEPVVRKVVDENPDTVRLVIKHHWLPEHKNARLAADVAVAADLQGKFWPVHEMMFDKHFAAGKDGATIAGYLPYLRTIPGLDVARLERDVTSAAVKARIDRETSEFKSTATPEFLINGHFHTGELTEAQLQTLIDQAAAGSK